MVMACVPIPGKAIVKSAEHVIDIDNYEPPPLPVSLDSFSVLLWEPRCLPSAMCGQAMF